MCACVRDDGGGQRGGRGGRGMAQAQSPGLRTGLSLPTTVPFRRAAEAIASDTNTMTWTRYRPEAAMPTAPSSCCVMCGSLLTVSKLRMP